MLRGLALMLLLLTTGCRACYHGIPQQVESRVAEVTRTPVPVDVVPCVAELPPPQGVVDLRSVWELALANNPALRQAGAEVEATRGQVIQAGLYPNPAFVYNQEGVGDRQSPPGTIFLQLRQEIVTAGKLKLDVAIAAQGNNAALLALMVRKYDVLTRVRRAFYGYQVLAYTAKVNDDIVSDLERAVNISKRQVEEAKSRPETDLIRMQTLLADAKVVQQRNRVNLKAAWGVLASEIGLPNLPMPEQSVPLPEASPRWDEPAVNQRVVAANVEIKQALVEAERAKIQVERARAGAIPNVTVGGGYWYNSNGDRPGAVLNAIVPIPVFNRNQGLIYEAQSRYVQAQATVRATETHLTGNTADAWGRYLGARQQAEQLSREIVPGLEKNLKGVRAAYEAGSTKVSFADILLAEQNLNNAKLRLADIYRELWRAVADLEGLMQLDLDEPLISPECIEKR
ncbi:MAG: TolC family protein [Planctomycetes bacterium]|nr:TolC family protein [Planctomycetota bacterium]